MWLVESVDAELRIKGSSYRTIFARELGPLTLVLFRGQLVVGIKIETFWISVIYSDPTGPTQKKPFSPLGIVFFFFLHYCRQYI